MNNLADIFPVTRPLFPVKGQDRSIQGRYVEYFQYDVKLKNENYTEYRAWCESNCSDGFYRFSRSLHGNQTFHIAFKSVDDAFRFKLIFG
jgi:hypothetical protein